MVSCAAYLEITKISIHAPARGATSLFKVGKTSNALFQSTPPARGATASVPRRSLMPPFQSTPPARGATQKSDPHTA